MNGDAWIDKFVERVNASARDAKGEDSTSPSVRVGECLDEVYGMWDWKVKAWDARVWVEDLEVKLPERFPRSFRSLITRYIFPPLKVGKVELLANTPEGIDGLYELRTGIFEDAGLAWPLLESGYIQFARPAGGGYDPICFDTGSKRGQESPIVRIDHERVLMQGKIRVREVIAPSFLALVQAFLDVEK